MTFTDWLILAGVTFVTIADVGLIIRGLPSVSRRFRVIGRELSFSALSWGILGGHFFGWGPDPVGGTYWISIPTLVVITIAISFIHRSVRGTVDLPKGWSLVYLLIGIPLGIFFWPL